MFKACQNQLFTARKPRSKSRKVGKVLVRSSENCKMNNFRSRQGRTLSPQDGALVDPSFLRQRKSLTPSMQRGVPAGAERRRSQGAGLTGMMRPSMSSLSGNSGSGGGGRVSRRHSRLSNSGHTLATDESDLDDPALGLGHGRIHPADIDDDNVEQIDSADEKSSTSMGVGGGVALGVGGTMGGGQDRLYPVLVSGGSDVYYKRNKHSNM